MGIAALVIVGVVVALLFETGVLPPHQSESASAAVPTTAAVPAAPTTPAPVAAAPPASAAAPAAASPKSHAAKKIASLPGKKKGAAGKTKKKSMQVALGHSNDPFLPTYDAKALAPAPPPIETVIPTFQLAANYLPPIRAITASAPLNQPASVPAGVVLGRVSGIILSNGVRAIYEADGQATIVQPGDELPDQNGRVQSIQADGVTIRLTDNRIVQLPVSAG